MFGLGLPEIIVIFVIALIVFGPKKLPDLGKSIGRAMAEFKKASEDFQESVRSEMKDVEKTVDVKEEVKQLEQLGKADTLYGAAGSDEKGTAPSGEEQHKEKKEHAEGNS
jgi:sec-independent protein translocase protein TatA